MSAAQVVLAGVTRNQLSDLAADGDLRRLRRGVYGLGPGAADAELEDIASAWLAIAGGQPAMASATASPTPSSATPAPRGCTGSAPRSQTCPS